MAPGKNDPCISYFIDWTPLELNTYLIISYIRFADNVTVPHGLPPQKDILSAQIQ